MSIIFHMTTPTAWRDAQNRGSYSADSLATEGFIHCSKPEQMVDTANHYYFGQHGYLLLVIDPVRVAVEVRYENTSGGSELYPHIYGPLNLDAVAAALPFEPGPDGRFTHLPDNIPGG